jgi:hypothetical protein
MARREVIEITCDRCGRTETQNKSEVIAEGSTELSVSFRSVEVSFQDLCRRCRGTVENLVSRLRMEKEEEDEPVNGKRPVGSKKSKKGLPTPDFQDSSAAK